LKERQHADAAGARDMLLLMNILLAAIFQRC